MSLSDWTDAGKRAAASAQQAAWNATVGATDAALTSALDGLAAAVRAVAARREPYSITIEVSAGPVSLSVTVPAGEEPPA